ncbi:MAG TPA: pitrilysin family protein, partial [Acidimicrobiia bacterium]|nr:pitrilysin family protein [Acidimicrobiia bacterium]
LLPSGLRVVTESLPELRSVTVGAWVGSGARDERDLESGASHFLEHLLFKGTEDRSAREIAEAVESVGGEMNAFTTHEQTVFYVRLPAAEAELAFEILGDVVWRPAFRPDDIESERQVILEEIGMRDDTPDDLVHSVFAATLFPDHPLGREVLGSEQTITEMARDAIAQYHGTHYQPSNVVLAAAGCLTHEQVLDQVDRHFVAGGTTRPPRANGAIPPPLARRVVERPTEQAHLVLGVRALPGLDPDRYALTVLNQALGGGMSSRLFQEVREQRGLAYSVYSYRVGFDDSGMFAIYAGTSPERLSETLAVVREQLQRIVDDHGIPARELDAAKGHIVGSLAMSLETSSSRMRRLGRGELVEGEIPSIDELIARVQAVQADDIARVVDRVLVGVEPTLAVVGPVDDAALDALV